MPEGQDEFLGLGKLAFDPQAAKIQAEEAKEKNPKHGNR